MGIRIGSLDGLAVLTITTDDVGNIVTDVEVVNNSKRAVVLGMYNQEEQLRAEIVIPAGQTQNRGLVGAQRVAITEREIEKTPGQSRNVRTFGYRFGYA